MSLEQEISKTTITWKKITSPDDNDYICKIKFENDIPVLKIKETLIVNCLGRLQYISEGTFDEKYELHGDNCKLTEQYIKESGLINDERTVVYLGTFENGVLKKGSIFRKKNEFLYKKGIFTGDMGRLMLVSGEKYDDGWAYNGEFYCDTTTPNILKKGKATSPDLAVTCEGEFSPQGRLTNGKRTAEFYDEVYIKKGIFNSSGEDLLQGKQILHNGVVMEGTFRDEQLRNGKVIYPGDNNGKKSTTIEGDFTNALFDSNGTIHRNSKYLKEFNTQVWRRCTLRMVPTRPDSYCSCIIA